MTEPYAMMHRKNFRIIPANKETMKHEDFIGITKDQFIKVNKNKQYGLVILKEEEQAKRRADYAEAEAYIKSFSQTISEEVPAAVQIASNEEKEEKVIEEDVPESVTPSVSINEVYDMPFPDLCKLAKSMGIKVHSTDKKPHILALVLNELEGKNGESSL